MESLKTIVKNETKHWYLSLILGVLFICVGIWVFKTPVGSYLALSILFSVTMYISGIFEIIYAVTNRKQLDNWGWVLAGGIINLLMGIWLMASPMLSVTVLPFVVAFMLMFHSMSAIGYAFDLNRFRVTGWGWLLVLGILGMLFSFILFWNPMFAGLTTVIWTGIAFVTLGVYGIILAVKLKRLHNLSSEHPRFNMA